MQRPCDRYPVSSKEVRGPPAKIPCSNICCHTCHLEQSLNVCSVLLSIASAVGSARDCLLNVYSVLLSSASAA
jgi:hypothetical protein